MKKKQEGRNKRTHLFRMIFLSLILFLFVIWICRHLCRAGRPLRMIEVEWIINLTDNSSRTVREQQRAFVSWNRSVMIIVKKKKWDETKKNNVCPRRWSTRTSLPEKMILSSSETCFDKHTHRHTHKHTETHLLSRKLPIASWFAQIF